MFSSFKLKNNKIISKNHKYLEIDSLCGFNFKNGFTLIELLAALVILAVMALIVYPTIGRIIINHKIKAYEQQINIIKKAAANWLTTNEDKLKDNSYPLPISDILNSGLIEEDELVNPINNELIDGCVLITLRKGIKQYDYNYVTSCDEFVIPKLLALTPSSRENEYGWRNKDFYISLNGEDLENYYYCIDNNKCEPNIMVDDVNETILFNEEGIKFVCAYGMNKSGETESICEKYKLDKTNPVIGTIVFSGTQGLDNWYVSDVSVSTIKSTDNLSGIASDTLSPIDTKVVKDTKGTTYTLTAKDKAGNVSSVSYSLKLDKTNPEVGTLVINGTKGENDWYISDLTFGVINGSDDISDHLTTRSSIQSLTTETSGTNVVVTTMNQAGLTSTKIYLIKMDKTAPDAGTLVINGTKGENGWYTSNLTLSVNNGTDNISGHYKTTTTHTAITTETKGTKVIVTTTNNAGLTSTRSYNLKMDKTPPIVGSLIANGTKGLNDWYTSNITFSVNNGSDDISGHISTIPSIYSITNDTDNTKVTITTKNGAGLTSSKDYYYKVDKTPPTCTLAVNASTVYFANKSSDVTSLGISTNTNPSYSNQTANISLNTFYGYLKDRAGNTGKCSASVASTSIAYDKTTNTCNESVSSEDNYTYNCSKSYDTCASGWTSCTWCNTSKCKKSTGSVNVSYTKSSQKCNRSVSGYTYNCKANNCPSYTTSSTCTKVKGCNWTNRTCHATTGSGGTSNCSGFGGSVTNKVCYITGRTSACPTGWTQTAKTPKYSYSFDKATTSSVNSCSKNTFTCNSSNYGSYQVTCSNPSYSCSSGTYPNSGSYCYIYSSGSSYNGCSSGTDTGSGCKLSNQSSCPSGWSSSVASSWTTYTYTYSQSSNKQTGLSSCSNSQQYSTCFGSYSSSQSSMKSKVNVTCSTNGYTCPSGYTKINNSYCYKLN